MRHKTAVTRMLDARSDMEAARQSGDQAAFNRAFSVFDRLRENNPEAYLDLDPELRED